MSDFFLFSLKQKIKEDAAKAIDARDGELEAIVSLNRSAAEQAHGKLLESEAMLLKRKFCNIFTNFYC